MAHNGTFKPRVCQQTVNTFGNAPDSTQTADQPRPPPLPRSRPPTRQRASYSHGQRRSNADKRRCVEIALREFGGLTNEAIAKMCAVAASTVADVSASSRIPRPEKRTGSDGKQYPATRRASRPTTPEEEEAGSGQAGGRGAMAGAGVRA